MLIAVVGVFQYSVKHPPSQFKLQQPLFDNATVFLANVDPFWYKKLAISFEPYKHKNVNVTVINTTCQKNYSSHVNWTYSSSHHLYSPYYTYLNDIKTIMWYMLDGSSIRFETQSNESGVQLWVFDSYQPCQDCYNNGDNCHKKSSQCVLYAKEGIITLKWSAENSKNGSTLKPNGYYCGVWKLPSESTNFSYRAVVQQVYYDIVINVSGSVVLNSSHEQKSFVVHPRFQCQGPHKCFFAKANLSPRYPFLTPVALNITIEDKNYMNIVMVVQYSIMLVLFMITILLVCFSIYVYYNWYKH